MLNAVFAAFICSLPMSGPPFDCRVWTKDFDTVQECIEFARPVAQSELLVVEGRPHRVLDLVCKHLRRS